MLAKRATLALLAVRTLSALATPIEPFMVQDSGLRGPSGPSCDAAESAGAPTDGPEIRLDDGVFVGVRAGLTDQYLGIPFALPP
jgi:hypothetical protein